MKRSLMRLFSFLLVLCLLLLSITSCISPLKKPSAIPGTTSTNEIDKIPQPSAVTVDSTASNLAYTLTQAEVDATKALIEECRVLVLSSTAEAVGVLEEKLQALEKAYYHIATQEKLAYLAYCVHQEDAKACESYLFASDKLSETYQCYIAMCREIDQSNCFYRESFFSEWGQESLEQMRGYSNELLECRRKNNQILVEYRALTNEMFSTGTAQLYLQMIQNNQRIAQLNGYENYWSYAYERIYERDFGKTEAQKLRGYVKKYLVPLCEEMFAKLYYSSDLREVEGIIFGKSATLGKNSLLSGYLSSFPKETEEKMKSIFDGDRSVFSSYSDSYDGAYTCYLKDFEHPICYFGPNYQGLYTVTHEMGHYYAALCRDDEKNVLDLAEIQSQGNEWLFTAYLKNCLPEKIYQTLVSYELYLSLKSIILGTLIDEFEQACYENPPTDPSQLDQLMNRIAATYGKNNFFQTYVANPNLYWRMVALESPVYYVSYAVSMIPSLELYCIAKDNYAKGQKQYLSLTKNEEDSPEFLATVSANGFSSPFEEKVYQKIVSMVK